MGFDLISAIRSTASAAIVTAVLSFALSRTTAGRIRVAAGIAVWFAVVVVLGDSGALNAPGGIGAAGLGIAALLPTVILARALVVTGRTGEPMIPLPALIAVNILRVLGISFVVLYAAHRLPAPFAPSAGWGDFITGVAAVPVAWLASRSGARPLVLAWNAFGFLDLVTALSLGAMSAPGPTRLFFDPPGTAIMASLPWIITPCFLVPSFLAIHVAIFERLRHQPSVTRRPSVISPSGRPRFERADLAAR
jgi:hypothetical protein